MKTVMSWIKISVINLAVLLGLFIVLEMGWSVYDKTMRFKERCNLDWILYSYCPNFKTTRLNHADDGGELIEIEVDDLGGRIQLGSNSTLQKAQNFLIGDSFIQADEMQYDNTIYGLWNKTFDNAAYGIGYSSWNPFQYFDAIKRIGKPNSHYFVFLMTNDVMPSYSRSVSAEMERKKYGLIINFISETLTFKILSSIRNSIFNLQKTSELDFELNRLEVSPSAFSVSEYQNCAPLFKLKDSSYSRKLGFDYLVYSKKYDCWPLIHKEAFDAFLLVVKDIERYVINDLSSKLTFVWVGAGWAHKNQASKGRLADEYGFSADISVTQKGLVNEFEKRFRTSDILDTEKIIAKGISSCPKDCKDKYFFTIDGHWTPETHQLVLYSLIGGVKYKN